MSAIMPDRPIQRKSPYLSCGFSIFKLYGVSMGSISGGGAHIVRLFEGRNCASAIFSCTAQIFRSQRLGPTKLSLNGGS